MTSIPTHISRNLFSFAIYKNTQRQIFLFKQQRRMRSSQVLPQNNSEKMLNENKCFPRISAGQESSPIDFEHSITEQPIVKYAYVSFTQFLQSLPKIPSIEQTRVWVMSCTEVVELEEHRQNLMEDDVMRLPFEDHLKTHDETEGLAQESERDGNDFKRKSVMPQTTTNTQHDLLADSKSQNQSIAHLQRIKHRRATTEEEMPLLMSSPRHSMNSLELPCSSTISTGSSCSMINSDNCSSVREEFTCFWNTCYHKESSVDKVFHHMLHSHLHRTTDFRASRCLWRGCSRDGILKVFSNRHQLLVHVGIHCQKLKEPNLVSINLN